MTLVDIAAPSAAVRTAVGRIEDWLLRSGVQLDEGPQRGGVAGWLDRDGQPEFVYLEITGYYLTAMAWLSSGAASSPTHARLADLRARRAACWMASRIEEQAAPATRLYLAEPSSDWRNNAVFSFDLAMAARGLAATRQLAGRRQRRRALAAICTRLSRISADTDVMASHELVVGDATTMPDRWSTRPGPHHLKAAAAVLHLPKRVTDESMIVVARRTCDHWATSFTADEWPCQELHAALYALEGMLIRATGGDDLVAVERVFTRLMELQTADGKLPETVAGGAVRSDVLAQALRVGMLLRGRQRLSGPVWSDRIDRLTNALLGFIRPDGGVLFALDQSISNTWCAMFAHQALYLRACDGAQTAPPAAAYELLV
ncbi:MAG: hypothetical protein QOD39_2219 [Mycobacterium sp.]|jgi:hypothetical protein|nr:hypothetical protein [Mycobacterium sp.]